MANTTFKGPVRSQNGFQELVGGVWTPVGGGGGGGGGGVTYIPYTPGLTNYTITGLTTPGDSASFILQYTQRFSGDGVDVTTTAIPGTDGVVFLLIGQNNDTVGVDASTTDFTAAGSNTLCNKFTVTYAGNYIQSGLTYAVMYVTLYVTSTM